MQVPSTNSALLSAISTATGIPARVVAGSLAGVPVGDLLNATVNSVTPREAVLTVNGQTLTVRPPPGVQLQPGAALLVRVPPTAAGATNPTIELSAPNAAQTQPQQAATGTAPRLSTNIATTLPDALGRAASATTAATTRVVADGAKPAAPPLAAPRLVIVDVVSPMPDGRIRVKIDGEEQLATSAQPLATGGRYVLEVSRTAAGLALKSPPDSPALPAEVATAILRTPVPTLAAALKPLQAELAALAAPPTSNPTSAPVRVAPPPTAQTAATTAVQQAAATVSETLRSLFPTDARPPDAAQLQNLVENGGLHYEAKLARLAEAPDATPTAQPTATASTATTERPAREADTTTRDQTANTAATPERTAAPTARDIGPDLKGDLLRLLQTVQDLGGAARAPAAQAALGGVEAQQATNTLAQTTGTPYVLQVPFPDNGVWRTMHVSLEPQNQPDQRDAERAGRFRVFMHVPLTDLGETWIDAGLAGDKFRATIYLDRPAVRDRVQSALSDLRTELQGEGFSEVLLDVRSSSELPERHRREAGAMQAGRPSTVSVLDVRA